MDLTTRSRKGGLTAVRFNTRNAESGDGPSLTWLEEHVMAATEACCISSARSQVMVDQKPSVKSLGGGGGDLLRLKSNFPINKNNRLLGETMQPRKQEE